MALGSLANQFDNRLALDFRGSSVLNQSYPVGGYAATVAFSPLSLFAAGEQGVWYDPSDLTTMFEDSAGTTPVHAPGNGTADSPVGKILDKSGRGNHATQTTSTARPTLSAKYNLLTYTQDFTNAAWTNLNSTITGSSGTSPDGTNTANLFTASSGSGTKWLFNTNAVTISTSISYTSSIYVKAGTQRYVQLSFGALGVGSINFGIVIDTTTMSIATTGSSSSGVYLSSSVTNVGSGWYLFKVSGSGANTGYFVVSCLDNSSYSTNPSVTTGGGTIYLWGADLRVTNDGVGLPAYQKVVDANTYDTTGFPYYLKADGVDDYLQVASFVMPLASRFACFGKNHLSIPTSYSGIFVIYPATGSDVSSAKALATYIEPTTNSYQITNSAINYSIADATVYSVGTKSVYSEVKIPGNGVLRKNGTQIDQDLAFTEFSTSDGGLILFSRWYPSSPAYFCAIKLYGLIVRGAATSASDVSNAETWMNGKTKAY